MGADVADELFMVAAALGATPFIRKLDGRIGEEATLLGTSAFGEPAVFAANLEVRVDAVGHGVASGHHRLVDVTAALENVAQDPAVAIALLRAEMNGNGGSFREQLGE